MCSMRLVQNDAGINGLPQRLATHCRKILLPRWLASLGCIGHQVDNERGSQACGSDGRQLHVVAAAQKCQSSPRNMRSVFDLARAEFRVSKQICRDHGDFIEC